MEGLLRMSRVVFQPLDIVGIVLQRKQTNPADVGNPGDAYQNCDYHQQVESDRDHKGLRFSTFVVEEERKHSHIADVVHH